MTEIYLSETDGGKRSEGAGHPSEGLHSLDAEGPRATAAPASTGAGTRLNLRDIPKTRTSFRAASEGLSSSRAAENSRARKSTVQATPHS